MVKKDIIKFYSIFLFIILISLANTKAQQTDYIFDEKIISSGHQCSEYGYREIGTFVEGAGLLVRHCIIEKPYDANSYYVVNSYFEFESGDCATDGGDDVGFFNDVTGKLIFLCVDRQWGVQVPEPKDNNIVKNVTITNSSSCPSGFHNTGLDISIQGGAIRHCALGGKAGGGFESVTRTGCDLDYAGTIPSIPNAQCVYNVNRPYGEPADIGFTLEATLNSVSSGESCPDINCTCVEKGSVSTNGWNCTAVNDIIRDRCGGFSGFINEISSECNYNLNVPGTGSSIGEVLNGATLQEGPVDICPNINCTCMERGFSLTSGWNCTSAEVTDTSCLFSNLKWKDGEGENDISSVHEKEKVLMFAEVSDVCELEREIKCDVYKYEGETLQDAEHPQGHANGEVTQKEGGPKRAYCEWTATKRPGTENDIDQQYYFKIWFADNSTYKVSSENIEILNETIIEPPLQPITINWSTSRWQKRDEPCPEDNFVVKITGDKMWCAEFIKSDGGEIFWGERRKVEKIRGTKPCGLFNMLKCPAVSCSILGDCEKLECEDNEAAIQSKNEYKIECAVMEDEGGTLVEMGEVKSRRNSGCGKDGVVVAAKKDIEYCAIGLVLGGEGSSEDEEDDEETDESEPPPPISGPGGGFMQGLKDLWTWIAPIVAPLLMKLLGGFLG